MRMTLLRVKTACMGNELQQMDYTQILMIYCISSQHGRPCVSKLEYNMAGLFISCLLNDLISKTLHLNWPK